MVLMSASGIEAQRSEVTCQEKLEGNIGVCHTLRRAGIMLRVLQSHVSSPLLLSPSNVSGSRTFPLNRVGMPIPPF